ncbi:hypothetical protein GTP45_09565 [Pseudoduganella sp. FT55W]|uniref:Uncharacterized protein n=1 Tax=Duganella rivi TaxID=2666083 RepID=A0A7X4KBE7_9BURK|nr:hypothetical protein [Duganella rivi]MYM67075.1 hypothetical protein [Duganella rivi]
MPTRLVLFFLVVLASAAVQAVERPIGCFAVQISEKSGVEQAKSLRLTDVSVSTPWGNGGANKVVPARAGERFQYAAAYWIVEGNDLILTFTNNGLSGIEFRVRSTEKGYKGVIQNFSDFGPGVDNARPVTLIRFDCAVPR